MENITGKDVVGYEGFYKVSSYGVVKSIAINVRCKNYTRPRPSKIRSVHVSKHGYIRVALFKKGVRKMQLVHRLVAEAFHPLSEFIGAEVNHIDGIKSNNFYLNLEWVSKSDNQKHAYRMGLKSAKGDLNGRRIAKLKSLSK
jgi:hypothetical protein